RSVVQYVVQLSWSMEKVFDGHTSFVGLICMVKTPRYFYCFFFNDTATTEIYTLSLHDALPISSCWSATVSLASSPKARPRTACSPRCSWTKRRAPERCGSHYRRRWGACTPTAAVGR